MEPSILMASKGYVVIHGGMDFHVTEREGMREFQEAQLKWIRSNYLCFPAEGH